jgi:multicomponent Na+:H+ antiporter subunit D
MCITQRHLKRLLAFSTVSHVGIFVIGVGLLTAHGVAGSALYVVGHGLAKAGLFMAVGILLQRFGSVDLFDLHGRGREILPVAVLFVVGALLLAATPMLTPFFGKSLLEASALDEAYWWVPAVVTLASALTAGAVLRVTGAVFAGWGPSAAPDDGQARVSREDEPEEEGVGTTPALMVIVPAVVLIAGVVMGLVPGFVDEAQRAADHFTEPVANVAAVLHGQSLHRAPAVIAHLTTTDFLYGAASVLGAFAVAALALLGRPLAERLPGPVRAPVSVLRSAHTGHVGDYVTWWTLGVGTIAGVMLLVVT